MNALRQGDVLLIPARIGGKTKGVKRDAGRVVLAYGEVTGHAHAILSPDCQLVTAADAEDLRMWLLVTAPEPVELVHEEHATVLIPPGEYQVIRQVEYAPEALRNVAD